MTAPSSPWTRKYSSTWAATRAPTAACRRSRPPPCCAARIASKTFAPTYFACSPTRRRWALIEVPGRYEANFVRERLVDMIAHRLKLDPAEVRRRNLIRHDEMPYDLGKHPFHYMVYDTGDFIAQLDRALGTLRLRKVSSRFGGGETGRPRHRRRHRLLRRNQRHRPVGIRPGGNRQRRQGRSLLRLQLGRPGHRHGAQSNRRRRAASFHRRCARGARRHRAGSLRQRQQRQPFDGHGRQRRRRRVAQSKRQTVAPGVGAI